MQFKGKIILSIIIFLVNSLYSIGQTKQELENRREEILKQLESTSRLLSETQKSRQSSMNRLSILNERIEIREEMINSMVEEISLLENEIDEKHDQIDKKEKELQIAREDYAEMVKVAYRNRNNYNFLIFILAAENFNQAYRRYKYVQQYTSERKSQIELIEEIKQEINENIESLEGKKSELQSVLNDKRSETKKMEDEKQAVETEIQQLREKEDELKKEIEERERTAQQLQKEINNLLAEEAEDTSREAGFEMTAEHKEISSQFKEKKGELPWPTDQGVVTGQFGEHSHPVLEGIKIQNNGIDILTQENAEVRVLHQGEVRRIISIPGLNNAVLIRHGDYLSVYSNLDEVYVNAGQHVASQQVIGRVYSDTENGEEAVLHLEIWEKDEKLDPMEWLSK